MRIPAIVFLSGLAAASCATAPEPDQPSPRAQQELSQVLAGKAAGAAVSCLPSYNANDMQIIDGRNVAFRMGSRLTYLMQLSPGCHLLGAGGYALLTHQFGGMGMCRGDIARVVDTSSRMTVGSCGIERIVPYSAPGR
jgi:Family of unknown function (DUF6491)